MSTLREMAEELERLPPVVCSTCRDSHRMWLEDLDRWVMCTACPVPCQSCRVGGTGPFCESTPCKCPCHPKRTEPPFCMHVPTREGCDCWQRAGRPLFGFREALARLEAYERSGCAGIARVLRIAAARRAERMSKA